MISWWLGAAVHDIAPAVKERNASNFNFFLLLWFVDYSMQFLTIVDFSALTYIAMYTHMHACMRREWNINEHK